MKNTHKVKKVWVSESAPWRYKPNRPTDMHLLLKEPIKWLCYWYLNFNQLNSSRCFPVNINSYQIVNQLLNMVITVRHSRRWLTTLLSRVWPAAKRSGHVGCQLHKQELGHGLNSKIITYIIRIVTTYRLKMKSECRKMKNTLLSCLLLVWASRKSWKIFTVNVSTNIGYRMQCKVFKTIQHLRSIKEFTLKNIKFVTYSPHNRPGTTDASVRKWHYRIFPSPRCVFRRFRNTGSRNSSNQIKKYCRTVNYQKSIWQSSIFNWPYFVRRSTVIHFDDLVR